LTNKRISYYKTKLTKMLKANTNKRILNKDSISKKNIVSVFESTLTRTMKIPINSLSKDIIIVKTFFFDVLQNIILDGFVFEGKNYVCFTASAGQIRTKKVVFINEEVYEKHKNSLMCGLDIEKINDLGGVNVNKYLAYLALCNSATDEWIDFNIDKSIVVDDMETIINGEVDFINDITYEITRKSMDIPICHTDGCGMMLPKISKKSFMVRLPWIKGLLVPFPFDEFIKENNCGTVKDIYGKEWNILNDDIEIIFTKSQFKTYRYYENWKQYKNNFKEFNCQVGICNIEEDYFSSAKIGYQMLQTLNELTDDELKHISLKTKDNVLNISSDRKTMLKVFGVTKSNTKKTYLQQAIELYPELLRDNYSKEILKDIKKSLVKEGRAAKLELDSCYTFLCPDLYAFCEYLFLGNKNPNGLLKNNEVTCKLYKSEKKLDCLRNPHLYREHAIRMNIVDEEKTKWFITNGIYTSCHDLISKILMFDNDGDKSLVCTDSIFVGAAERHMKDIVPLYYNMRKAEPDILSNQAIYNGLKLAYAGGNIGIYSNDITKIWNSENVNLDVIKVLCMENNFVIDYAKTLYKPIRPQEQKKKIHSYAKSKTPHFFIYVKDKNTEEVEKKNTSVVNKLEKIIIDKRINFDFADFDEFNYKLLMYNEDVEIDELIINKYKTLDRKTHYMLHSEDDKNYNNITFVYQGIRNDLLKLDPSINYIVDVLIKYLYKIKDSKFKDTLWLAFGDIIIENLKRNVKDKYIYCENCGVLTKQSKNNKTQYCKKCWIQYRKKYQRELMRKIRR